MGDSIYNINIGSGGGGGSKFPHTGQFFVYGFALLVGLRLISWLVGG